MQETKLNKLSQDHIDEINLRGLSYIDIPATDSAGGLLTLWSKNMIVRQIFTENKIIGILLLDRGTLIINKYMDQKIFDEEVSVLGNFLKNKTAEETDIILSGDFNSFPIKSDTSNSDNNWDVRIKRFQKLSPLLNKHDLHDMAEVNQNFEHTHFDKKNGSSSRIDFVFTNCLTQFNTLNVYSNPFSDHSIIHCLKTKEKKIERGQGRWKLNDQIIEDNYSLINKFITVHKYNLSDVKKYDSCKNDMKDFLRSMCLVRTQFEKEIELKRKKKIEKIDFELKNYELPETMKNMNNKEIYDLRQKINEMEQKKMIRKLDRIKEIRTDIKEGVSKEVKKILRMQQNKSTITKLLNGQDQMLVENETITQEFFTFYRELYDERDTDEVEKQQILNRFVKEKHFAEKLIRRMEKPISEIEVTSALRSLNKKSAPGPDGMTTLLYQRFEKTWAPILKKLFNDVERGGSLPDSFGFAIIKVLPKKENAIRVKDYRPVSLINTDQKIFSHVIANRLKKGLQKLIGEEQIAYLKKRNIHQVINLTKLACERMKNESCVVALDFSKAFDSIDRNYLYNLLQVIGTPSNIVKCIKAIYEKTTAVVEVNHHMTKSVEIKRGVRQGCPLSALLFILGIEPLLLDIKNDPFINTNFVTKVSAYADDITCYVKSRSLEALFDRVKCFCDATQLSVNVDKTEILSRKSIQYYETQKKIKILGMEHKLDDQANYDLFQQKISEVQKSVATISKRIISMRAKAINFEIFIYSKLIYVLRHTKVVIQRLERFQRYITKGLWMEKRAAVASDILCLPTHSGGIGLPNIKLKTFAAAISDWKNSFFHSNLGKDIWLKQLIGYEKGFLHDLKKSLLRSLKLKIDIYGDQIMLVGEGRQLQIVETTKMKEIYLFLLITEKMKRKVENCLAPSCRIFGVSTQQLLSFNKFLWKAKSLYPHEKNLMYRVLHASCSDKPKMMQLNLIQDDNCTFCKQEQETIEHVLFHCPVLENLRREYKLKSWKNIFADKSSMSIHFETNVLIGAWKNEGEKTMEYLNKTISRWSQENTKIG